MKVLLLSTYISGGGAANATLRLLYALRSQGIEVRLLYLLGEAKGESSETVAPLLSGALGQYLSLGLKALERLDIVAHNGYSIDRLWAFSSASTGINITKHPWWAWADIVHLHWVNHGLLSRKHFFQIASSKKVIVWTLHDLWAVTGGCHIPAEFCPNGLVLCQQFFSGCGLCPLLKGTQPKHNDYSRQLYKEKTLLHQGNIHYISVSQREAELFMRSPLRRGQSLPSVIPPPLALGRYKDATHRTETPWYNKEKRYLLIVASKLDDLVKGPHLLIKMINHLAPLAQANRLDIELILAGRTKNDDIFSSLNITTHVLGTVSTDELMSLYQIADVTISTSVFETYGQTLTESLASGTPVVSFRSYGPEEIVHQGINGYLVEPYDTRQMAKFIIKTIQDLDQRMITQETCRASVAHLDEPKVATQHIELYQRLLRQG